MLLYTYYSLDEVINKRKVLSLLNKFQKEGKIKYNIEIDVIYIEDLDLDEYEINEIADIFDNNDVFPYLERDNDQDDESFGYYDDYDDY